MSEKELMLDAISKTAIGTPETGKQYGDKSRIEVDAELLNDSQRTDALMGHDCDQFETVEQMSEYIRENFIDVLSTEYKERAIEFLIDDLNTMRKHVFDL